MSVNIMKYMIDKLSCRLMVDESKLTVILFTFTNNCDYEMLVQVGEETYKVVHYEPLNPKKGQYYGMGPYYDCYHCKIESNTENPLYVRI